MLPLIVAAQASRIPFLPDGIDFVDKDNAGSLFLGLLKQISNLRSAHSNEHFNKFRARYGEKRHAGFTGDRLCQHRLARTGRPHQKNTLRHRSAYVCIFLGIMQIIYNLRETLFCFVLTGNVVKMDPFGRLYVNLGTAVPHAKGHRVFPAHLLHHFFRIY